MYDSVSELGKKPTPIHPFNLRYVMAPKKWV